MISSSLIFAFVIGWAISCFVAAYRGRSGVWAALLIAYVVGAIALHYSAAPISDGDRKYVMIADLVVGASFVAVLLTSMAAWIVGKFVRRARPIREELSA